MAFQGFITRVAWQKWMYPQTGVMQIQVAQSLGRRALRHLGREAMTDKKFSTFAQFRAVLLWPYDMDLITFYEFYGHLDKEEQMMAKHQHTAFLVPQPDKSPSCSSWNRPSTT